MPLLNGINWYPDTSRASDGTSRDSKVYRVRQTSEIFHSYEEYLQRIRLLQSRQWSSLVSGRHGLNYEEALHEDSSVEALVAKVNLLQDIFRGMLRHVCRLVSIAYRHPTDAISM